MSLVPLVPILGASLLGSLHCLGMCGGLVAVASDGVTGRGPRSLTQLLYHAGRLVAYGALGVSAALLGSALDLAGTQAGFARGAAVVSGSVMVLWGLAAMLSALGIRRPSLRMSRLLPARALDWMSGLHSRPPYLRAVLLGSASAFLPCGWLYAFVLAAAGTGNAWHGLAIMAAFWAGNLPALLGFGWALGGVLQQLRRHLPLLSAAMIFCVGWLTLSSRLNLPAFALSAVTQPHGAAQHSSQAVPAATECPCHRKGPP